MTKFLTVSFLLSIALVILGINRGFDISDEGLYLLLSDPAQENFGGILSYDLFFKALYKITGFSFTLISLRVFRLLLYLIAAWAMADAWKTLSKDSKIRLDIFLLMGLGVFAGYSFLPPSLSYNSLTLVLAALWFSLLVKEIKSIRIVGIGFVLAILVYVKIPSALVLGLVTLLILIKKKRFIPINLFMLILPFIGLELFFFFLLGENFSMRVWEGYSFIFQRPDYSLFHLLKINLVGIFWLILPGIPFGLAGFLSKSNPKHSLIFLSIGIFVLVGVCYLTHITAEWNHLFLLGFFSYLGFTFGKEIRKSRYQPIILILIFLPFFLHLGSNVYWLRLGIHFLVFWVLAGLILCRDQKNLKTGLVGNIGVFVPIGIFIGIWWKPFEMPLPLWEANTSIQLPKGGQIWVDQELAQVLKSLSEQSEIQGKEKVLAIYSNPGLVYLLGKTMPKTPGVWDEAQLEQLIPKIGKPDVLLYNEAFPLPPSLSYTDSIQSWILRDSKLILLK